MLVLQCIFGEETIFYLGLGRYKKLRTHPYVLLKRLKLQIT